MWPRGGSHRSQAAKHDASIGQGAYDREGQLTTQKHGLVQVGKPTMQSKDCIIESWLAIMSALRPTPHSSGSHLRDGSGRASDSNCVASLVLFMPGHFSLVNGPEAWIMYQLCFDNYYP